MSTHTTPPPSDISGQTQGAEPDPPTTIQQCSDTTSQASSSATDPSDADSGPESGVTGGGEATLEQENDDEGRESHQKCSLTPPSPTLSSQSLDEDGLKGPEAKSEAKSGAEADTESGEEMCTLEKDEGLRLSTPPIPDLLETADWRLALARLMNVLARRTSRPVEEGIINQLLLAADQLEEDDETITSLKSLEYANSLLKARRDELEDILKEGSPTERGESPSTVQAHHPTPQPPSLGMGLATPLEQGKPLDPIDKENRFPGPCEPSQKPESDLTSQFSKVRGDELTEDWEVSYSNERRTDLFKAVDNLPDEVVRVRPLNPTQADYFLNATRAISMIPELLRERTQLRQMLLEADTGNTEPMKGNLGDVADYRCEAGDGSFDEGVDINTADLKGYIFYASPAPLASEPLDDLYPDSISSIDDGNSSFD